MYLIDHYIVDWWSLSHILTWAVISYFVTKRYKLKFGTIIIGALLFGYMWEVTEAIIESYLNFREPHWNRWVADPIFDLIGGIIGYIVGKKTSV